MTNYCYTGTSDIKVVKLTTFCSQAWIQAWILCRYSPGHQLLHVKQIKLYHVTILHTMYIALPVQMKIMIYIISGTNFYINIALCKLKIYLFSPFWNMIPEIHSALNSQNFILLQTASDPFVTMVLNYGISCHIRKRIPKTWTFLRKTSQSGATAKNVSLLMYSNCIQHCCYLLRTSMDSICSLNIIAVILHGIPFYVPCLNVFINIFSGTNHLVFIHNLLVYFIILVLSVYRIIHPVDVNLQS